MKHFIGGFALGLILGIIFLRKLPGNTRVDYAAAIAGHLFVALMFGAMAWGLLP